jgi:hypothetical protein
MASDSVVRARIDRQVEAKATKVLGRDGPVGFRCDSAAARPHRCRGGAAVRDQDAERGDARSDG